jgi:hypothetical protein
MLGSLPSGNAQPVLMFRRRRSAGRLQTPGTKATAGCGDALHERMAIRKFQSGNRRAHDRQQSLQRDRIRTKKG